MYNTPRDMKLVLKTYRRADSRKLKSAFPFDCPDLILQHEERGQEKSEWNECTRDCVFIKKPLANADDDLDRLRSG